MQDLPLVREMHGFRRTECACPFCTVYCRHMPGTLDPSDLRRLCDDERNLLAWAETHLRALVDQPYPALVPARNHLGHCHWFFDGQCAVHEHAPYGCAFFDAHQSAVEVTRRAAATIQACQQDAASKGPYSRVWQHLCAQGLLGQRGDRQALRAELQDMRRRVERSRRRASKTG